VGQAAATQYVNATLAAQCRACFFAFAKHCTRHHYGENEQVFP
jgi:hypothetical protein